MCNGDALPVEDLYLFNTGTAERAYLTLGCHYCAALAAHRFLVWAPNARAVSLVGDFNDWDPAATPMQYHETGVWVAFVPGLADGALYKYYLQGADGSGVYKADPFAFHAESAPGTASKVWSLSGYAWHDQVWRRRRASFQPRIAPISIYELHLGSWRAEEGQWPWYRQVADELARYCRDMGYTHVEVLPVTEYPFEESWGYQVTGFFAPTSRYGTPQDFMYFVDTLHAAGIGVLIDWVPGHFPTDEFALARFDGTCLFEHENPLQGYHPDWGTLLFNYGRPEVQSFLVSSAMFFFDYYHIDGIRVDAVSSMLYLDYGRNQGEYIPNQAGGNINLEAVAFLQKLNQSVQSAFPYAMMVAEEATAYPKVTGAVAEGGLGFTFKWDMGFMHDTLEYFQMDHLFRHDHHSKLTFSMLYAFSEYFVLAFSHDEVVHGKRSLLDKMFGDYGQKFASVRALYGYQYGHPGKKLNFMGAEFGQFIEWNHHQQLDWMLLDYPSHQGLQKYLRALNHLYLREPALFSIENSWQGFYWANVDDRDQSAIAFLRRAEKGDSILVACNFIPVLNEGFLVGLPGPGQLVEILNSDDTRFGGSGQQNAPVYTKAEAFGGQPYVAAITLPPLSTIYFRFVAEKIEKRPLLKK